MKIKDEHFREELRWRDETPDAENKRREENLAAVLQQKDEEWREELGQRDKALRVELKKKRKSLYVGSANERLRADQANGSQGKGNGTKPALEGRSL